MSFGCEVVFLLLLEEGTVLVIAARVAVVDISNFGPTLGAFLFPFVYSDEHSQVEISLEADHGHDVLAMSTCCRTDCTQNNSQRVLLLD